ncbi:carboxypeptidase-like regulatory domain-containing protein [Paenibacillus terrae]|uniref:carboxypeptidase-like regulatory domain-containing protein n=1 Tax=Paenibacillus terrae TaxID=159743 RepID=UPI0011EB239D|nr:carboxypeptidase-like regulatory domain-containing protein [Paenibacillus terrae]
MKRFKKAIAVMLSTMLLFAFGMTANASQSTEGVSDQAIKAESNVQLTTENESVIKQLTRADKPDSITSSVYAMKEDINFKTPETPSLKKETVPSLKASPTAATASTATYSGTITEEGGTQFLYPIYLQPGELLQAQLDGPFSAQLDYDLYLYEFDMTTGDINPNAIDASTYGTYFNNYEQGAASLPENVGARNAIGSEKAYAIAVHAKKGSSINDPFYLTVDISSSYDAYEPDESAFHAYNFTFSTGGSSLNSRSIHSGIDNDWYQITIPASRNYDALNVKLDSTSESYGYKAEVYGALSGNQMVLLPQTNHNVSLNTGSYYVRVYTTNQYSADHLYTLTLKPVLRAGKIVITSYDSSKNGPNDYPTYSYGRHYRVNGSSSFTVKGVVTTTDNFPVVNALVDVTWLNQNWTESSGNRTRTGTAYTDQNGAFSVTVSLPPSTGSIAEYLSGAISFTHYFDLSGVAAQVRGTSIIDTDVVYHFAYSIYGG